MTDLRSAAAIVRAVADELAAHFPGGTHLPDPCLIGGRKHPAQDGMLICDGHRQELSRILRNIEEETLYLSVAPAIAIAYDSGPGSGAPAFERSPVRPDVSVLTDRRRGTGITRTPTKATDFDEADWDPTPSVLETLHAWARQVRTERRFPTPTVTVVLRRWTAVPTGPICWHPPLRPCAHRSCAATGRPLDLAITDTVAAQPTVTGERDLLTRQLDWIARQPWVDDMHTELADLLTQLRRANGSLEPSVGTCGSLQPTGALCEGKVWHIVLTSDGTIRRGSRALTPSDEPGFRCSACHRVWTGTDAVRKRADMWIDEQKRKHQA